MEPTKYDSSYFVPQTWVLSPLSNSWTITTTYLYKSYAAHDLAAIIDCYSSTQPQTAIFESLDP